MRYIPTIYMHIYIYSTPTHVVTDYKYEGKKINNNESTETNFQM